MATPAKEQAVQELEERFSKAQALVFTDFRGLNANQMVELRQKLRAQNLEFRVVKNRLAQRAAESAGLSFDGVLEGPTAICFGYDDPVLAFKQSVTLTKEFPNYAIKGGLSEGQFVDADGVKELAELPSHEELLTQLAGAFQGPIRNLSMVLNGMIRQLVVGLSEVAKVKPEPDAADAATDESETSTAEAESETAVAADERAEEAEADAVAEDVSEDADDADVEETDAESAETEDDPEASAADDDGEDESEDDEPTEAEDAETETDADVEDDDADDEDSDDDSEDKKGEST